MAERRYHVAPHLISVVGFLSIGVHWLARAEQNSIFSLPATRETTGVSPLPPLPPTAPLECGIHLPPPFPRLVHSHTHPFVRGSIGNCELWDGTGVVRPGDGDRLWEQYDQSAGGGYYNRAERRRMIRHESR